MKGQPWCASLPIVHIRHAAEPKPVCFILPYYDNPRFLRQQIGWWGTYPEPLKTHLQAIIVDDGSPTHPAEDVISATTHPFPVRLFRLEVDVRWNWLAARNIGFYHAPDGWCVVTDMDHVIPASTADALVHGAHDARVIYAFSRREHTGETVTPHSASFFLTRQMFWKVGGYDETLSGHYGTDGDWRRRCAKVAPLQVLEERLIRHEYQGDSSTTRYLRKQPQDAGVRKLIAQRKPGWKAKTLSFPYHEVVGSGCRIVVQAKVTA